LNLHSFISPGGDQNIARTGLNIHKYSTFFHFPWSDQNIARTGLKSKNYKN